MGQVCIQDVLFMCDFFLSETNTVFPRDSYHNSKNGNSNDISGVARSSSTAYPNTPSPFTYSSVLLWLASKRGGRRSPVQCGCKKHNEFISLEAHRVEDLRPMPSV